MPPRLTKKARARARETEKADKALGGAKLASTTDNKPHFHAELQWFRLLRGQTRLNQIARILVELSPTSVFDPRHIYDEQIEDAKTITLTTAEDPPPAPKSKKGKKEKVKKLSKKEQIIANNKAKQHKQAAARDVEKLRSLGDGAPTHVKLKTDSGKFLLLLQLLRKAVKNKNIVDSIDTLWEIENVAKDLPQESAKKSIKDFSKYITAASIFRDNVKEYIPLPSDTDASGFNEKSWFKPKNLTEFQLTYMADRLPPLNLHALKGKFRLDPWQMRVLQLIKEKKSVLITAPTSCGKTVLSTFVCTVPGAKTLFVVPTEPLAWQVAAMLRALKLNISLVVPTLNFVPPAWDVVVGTPQALESALTKQIGFDFDFAVYDEVHSLNTEGGEALQRLIKVMPSRCRILALSATIGNSTELLKWFNDLLNDGKGQEVVLVKHKARFINLQRHIWTYADDCFKNIENTDVKTVSEEERLLKVTSEPTTGRLRQLHPALSLSVDYLASEGFNQNDLAFTPIDTFNLYKSLEALISKEMAVELGVDLLKPRKYFNQKAEERITLVKAKEYEDELKSQLAKLAKLDKLACKKIMCSLAPDASIKEVKVLETEEEVDQYLKAHVDDPVTDSKNSTSAESLTALSLKLKKMDVLPSILFQLDSVRCQSLFDALLTNLEELEKLVYPSYHEDLLNKEKQAQKAKDQALKAKSKNRKNEEDGGMEESDFNTDSNVDVGAPHPDFSLSPPGRGVGATEAKNLVLSLKHDLPKASGSEGGLPHPLIRGLRRGIGLYISGLPASYQRVVQSYAQAGRLGVVLSDELLAYGVNMPFRSAVFFGDPGEHWLTPLVHQQMAGRAGRRGLDRQGHLIYAGFDVDRLRQLLRGELPDITGKMPLYPTVPLQLVMNQKFDSAGQPLTEEVMNKMCSPPLDVFIKNIDVNEGKGEEVENYFQVAQSWMDHLGVVDHPASSYQDLIPELVWELRQFLPESLALEGLMEDLIDEFKAVPVSLNDADVKMQERVCLLFSLVCARKPAYYFIKGKSSISEEEALKGSVMEHLYTEDELPSSCTKFTGVLGDKERDREDWERWVGLVKATQQRIAESKLGYKEHMLLPWWEVTELDNMCHSAFKRNQVDPALPSPLQHELRERIWTLGEVLRTCFNVLGRSKELAGFTSLLRKSFVRIRYILDETAQRNWKALDQQKVSFVAKEMEEGMNLNDGEQAPNGEQTQ